MLGHLRLLGQGEIQWDMQGMQDITSIKKDSISTLFSLRVSDFQGSPSMEL